MNKFLSGVASGKVVEVVNIDGGMGAVKKLQAMGIIPGTELKVIRSSGRGPLIIEARGAKLMLGRGMSDKIAVKTI